MKYKIVFDKEFITGNLAGLTLPGYFYTTLDAAPIHLAAMKRHGNHTDFSNSYQFRYHNVRLEQETNQP